MTPEFSSLVNPVIDYVLELVERLQRGESPKLDVERDKISNEIGDARQTAAAMNPPLADEFQIAQRFLVYWADEVLTAATVQPGGEPPKWAEYTLEWKLYKEQERAWKFYVQAEQQAKHSRSDVLEVVFLAMVLGFRGDIPDAWRQLGRQLPQGKDSKQLREAWAREIYEIIKHSSTSQGEIPEGPPLEGDTRPLKGKSLRSTAMFLAMICIIVFVILAVRQFYGGGGGTSSEKGKPSASVRGMLETSRC